MLILWLDMPRNLIGQFVRGDLPPFESEFKVCDHADPQALPELKSGDVILAFGKERLAALQASGVYAKNRTIGSVRQSFREYGAGHIAVTYSPGIKLSDHKSWVDLLIDVRSADKFAATGTNEPETGDYKYVNSLQQVIDHVLAQSNPVDVFLDLETVSLNPYADDAYIVSLSVTYQVGQSSVIYFANKTEADLRQRIKLFHEVKFLLTDPRVRIGGANLKFDLHWIFVQWGIVCTNYTNDTTILGSLLNENRSNSLNNHAKIYTEMGGYDDAFNAAHDKSRMQDVPQDELLAYAGGDTDACARVFLKQRDELKQQKNLAVFYAKLMRPAMNAFAWMERIGVCVDVPYLQSLESELQDQMNRIWASVLPMLSTRLKIAHANHLAVKNGLIADHLFSDYGLNLKPLMRTERTGQASAAANHLKLARDHYGGEAAAFIDKILEWRATQKTLTTYVTGFLRHLRSDGRFHPTYILHHGDWGSASGGDGGTVSGRTSAKDPSFQTLPKKTKNSKMLRKAYPAPPGYRLLLFDFSQGELRVTACIANEQTMIDGYKAGIDLHLATGAQLNDLTIDQALALKESDPGKFKMIRQGGKAGNFGLIYGMGADGYQAYARDTYGVDLSKQEAVHQRDNFFKKYKALQPWHQKQKALVHRQMFVDSPLGRRRNLPLIKSTRSDISSKAERQAINSPVQSTLTDMTCLAAGIFWERYGDQDDCVPCMMIHDAIGFYVREEQFDQWQQIIQEIMEDLPLESYFGWRPQLKFVVDYEHGENLSELQEG